MRKGPILPIVSAMFIIAGVALVGVSVAQKVEMNVSSGSFVLPELAFHNQQGTPSDPVLVKPVKKGDYLGTISIPVLRTTLPIYEGTESAQLKKGVGHFQGSVMPGIKDNAVLAGHRDSVFSQLGKLKVGQMIVVDTARGKFTYKIYRFRIVKSDDRTVIVPSKKAILTLSTCYPFYFIGPAPRRFIVSATLISTQKLLPNSSSIKNI